MSSFILWGLIAFLIVDVVLLVLVLRWNDGEKKSSIMDTEESHTPVPPVQAAKTSVPPTPEPEEPTVPLSTSAIQPTRGEHVFTFDLAHDEPDTERIHDGSPLSVATMQSTKNGVDNEQLFLERSYLRQKASSLETRIAALTENTDATSDYQRGMRAVLEEELHATWTRLGELESESGRVNHATTK
jgi:hypothetical protein